MSPCAIGWPIAIPGWQTAIPHWLTTISRQQSMQRPHHPGIFLGRWGRSYFPPIPTAIRSRCQSVKMSKCQNEKGGDHNFAISSAVRAVAFMICSVDNPICFKLRAVCITPFKMPFCSPFFSPFSIPSLKDSS